MLARMFRVTLGVLLSAPNEFLVLQLCLDSAKAEKRKKKRTTASPLFQEIQYRVLKNG